MYRVRRTKRSKRGVTLVELLVAMTLTAIFAGSCVMLMLPIEKIYTHTNDLSRAQVLADTIVDELRAECSNTYITHEGDAWISSSGAAGMTSVSVASGGSGPVLVIRRNEGYCETIAANYAITSTEYSRVTDCDENLTNGSVTSRAIYRMFPGGSSTPTLDASNDYVHFGYFVAETSNISDVNYVFPHITQGSDGKWTGYYDFTSPFTSATYGDFTVELTFSDLTCDQSGIPAFVMCMVTINKPGLGAVYTRNAVLCFS